MENTKTLKAKDDELPHNWRILVANRLATVGTIVTSRKVFDVCARGCKNPTLEKQILDAVTEIKREFKDQHRTRKKLRTVVGLN